MIVCINCHPDTKAKMDILVKGHHYKDYSELISIAIENLWILEQGMESRGAVVINEEPVQTVKDLPFSLPATYDRANSSRKPAHSPIHQREAADVPSAYVQPSPLGIPELFLSAGLDKVSMTTVEIPLLEGTGERFTVDRWLFGQYNKLLPLKVNCRALARLADGQDGVPLASAAAKIAEAAAQLGDYLVDHDRRHQIRRDDALATAFPRSGPDAEKSRSRYANQFVGSLNSHNILIGLLWDYRLASVPPESGGRLLLTSEAVELAKLPNPILDGFQADLTQKFSSEEITFLLDHIRKFVTVESFAFRTLLKAIIDGADTPDKLDEGLRVLMPTNSNRSLSPSFLSSQRSGALSRMADLGLIARERKGVRVSYVITEQGQHFIEKK